MEIPGPSTGRTSAISRFLAAHQEHDAGFDVRREEGSGTGRLKIVCLGCGKSVEYHAPDGAAEGLKGTARLEPQAQSSRRRDQPSGEAKADRRAALRRRRVTVLIGLLIGVALVAATLLLLTGGGSDHSRKSTPAASSAAPVSTQPVAPAPATPPPQPRPKPRSPRLRAATFFDRYRIGVPAGWRHEEKGAVTVLHAPGTTALIDVYFAQDPRSLPDLGSASVRFLKDRHRGAQVTAPAGTRVGDLSGLKVTATYNGGSETAVVLTSGGYAYLLVRRIGTGAPAFRVQQAAASLASFRPV